MSKRNKKKNGTKTTKLDTSKLMERLTGAQPGKVKSLKAAKKKKEKK